MWSNLILKFILNGTVNVPTRESVCRRKCYIHCESVWTDHSEGTGDAASRLLALHARDSAEAFTSAVSVKNQNSLMR